MKADQEETDILLSWSGGKDSCMALQALQQQGVRVRALLTTVTEDFDRISMHGVRRSLLRQQAASLSLPLREIMIPRGASNAQYEARMAEALEEYRRAGIVTCAFGDLFLEDIRAYRDRQLEAHGMRAIYPLWGRDTSALIRDFIAQGFKTAVVCVDPRKLPPAFTGRIIDAGFLADLPHGVDPCGENGEFHTFVFDGPIFTAPVRFSFGETVCREGFWFCDLVPDA
ncbi:MAG: adenine nucleotide alpha hydrolase [Alphaproteobacteria bacterium]|nr:adenine nucleotide alpha hydrolase [Alphaproteobacteria bacterium]